MIETRILDGFLRILELSSTMGGGSQGDRAKREIVSRPFRNRGQCCKLIDVGDLKQFLRLFLKLWQELQSICSDLLF